MSPAGNSNLAIIDFKQTVGNCLWFQFTFMGKTQQEFQSQIKLTISPWWPSVYNSVSAVQITVKIDTLLTALNVIAMCKKDMTIRNPN